MYSSIGKPFVDLCVFNYQLFHSLGPLALTGLFANYFFTAALLRRLSPPFGKLKAVEGRREGDFRALHARLIVNAEEVAFYGGADTEREFLDRGFFALRTWMEGIYGLKIRYNMLEDFVLKYSWSAFGYLISALPVFLPAWGGLGGASELVVPSTNSSTATSAQDRSHARMKSFITNKRLMLSLSDAGSRIMYSIKDLSELAGYTSRIYTLLSTLHRVHANAYHIPRGISPDLFSLSDIQGTTHLGYDGLRLEDVPIVAPSPFPRSGTKLLSSSLSFAVGPGEHLLISGPNGVGKSSVARVLAGLWPVYRGLVSRPRRIGQDGILFLPQRPYLSLGTLRDQVIYPSSALDMREAGRTDAEVRSVLEAAKLGYLPDREGGLDARKAWSAVLSGGERQRMQIARVLWAEPRFAVLDEGTSAVSQDVEGSLYEACKSRGVTVVTVSTRVSLKRYHSYCLSLGTGDQGDEWSWEKIGSDEEKGRAEREVGELRAYLEQVEGWKARLEEVQGELGRVWVKGTGPSDGNAVESDESGSGSGELVAPEYLVEGGEASGTSSAEPVEA